MKIPRKYHHWVILALIAVIGIPIFGLILCDGTQPGIAAAARRERIVETRSDISKIFKASQTYEQDLETIARIKAHLVNGRVTSDELGLMDFGDREVRENWIGRLRIIALVHEAQRATDRIIKLQEKIAAETPNSLSSQKPYRYRVATPEEFSVAEADFKLIDVAMEAVSKSKGATSLHFGTVEYDTKNPTDLYTEGVGFPDIGRAEEYLSALKNGLPAYFNWSPGP